MSKRLPPHPFPLPLAGGEGKVSLICVGSELLRGKINTHASTLARRLASIGLELTEVHTIGDDQAALARLIRRALDEHPIVMITGGLGPTFDDLTREAAAVACGKRLVLSPKLLRAIHAKFRRARYRKMPPANQRQAYLLEGAIPIPNRVGTAPGQWVEIYSSSPAASGRGPMGSPPTTAGNDVRRVLILLPGPPSELTPMLDDVLPVLRKAFPTPPTAEAHLHFVGVPESIVDHRIRPIIEQYTPHPNPLPRRGRGSKGEGDVQFTILAHLGLVDFDMFVTALSREKAENRLRRIAGKVRRVMGRAFYGMNDAYPLEKVVGDAFRRARATLAVAESCTGGMLAKTLTDVPGSSDYFSGGIVAYRNAVKTTLLNVPDEMLRRYGAASRQVSGAMAEGVRKTLQSTWGVGITGMAGPGGGTKAKPVGLIYIGLAGPRVHKTVELRLRGSRDAVRQRAVISVLDMLRQIYL